MTPDLAPHFPEVIDSTIRGDFVSCEMKYLYSRVYGLSGAGGSVHLIAGHAFAKGCEVTRRKFYSEGLSEEDAILEGIFAAWIDYGSFEPEERYAHKSAERVAYALIEYFAEYPLATDKIQPHFRPDGTPAIEFEFTFPLKTLHPETGNPILYGGRFDMVGSYLSDLWVVDEKTATMLGPSWLKSFTLRGQLLGYTYAARAYDLPVAGFLVRGISFLKNYYGHAEVFEVVPAYRLEQWRNQIELDAARMVEAWNKNQYSYDFHHACTEFGGCPFLRLCDKQDWREWWKQYYEIDYWNPLEQKKTKPTDQAITVFSS